MALQVNFFSGEKKSSGSKKSKGAAHTVPAICQRPLATAPLSERKFFEESFPYVSSSRLPGSGSAVKQLASDFQSPLILGKSSDGSSASSGRNIGTHHSKIWESWSVGRITFVTVLGCIVFAALKLSGISDSNMRRTSKFDFSKTNVTTSLLSRTLDSSLDYNIGPAHIKESGVASRLKKLLAMANILVRNHSDAGNPHVLSPAASISSSMTAVFRRLMPMEEAEALVRQWQAIKAEALGPSHQVHTLSEVLDESMLVQVKCMDWSSHHVIDS